MEQESKKKPGDKAAEEKLQKWLHDVGLSDEEKEDEKSENLYCSD